MIIILMGVAGSGKTTIGQMLSAELGWPFFDGDDFHPQSNVQKMSEGIPLTDEDRLPWLAAIRSSIETFMDQEKSAVFACSALKASYRQILRHDNEPIQFVYLKGDYELLQQRLQEREAHFMKAELLMSQLEDLEEPRLALTVDISLSPGEIVRKIREKLRC